VSSGTKHRIFLKYDASGYYSVLLLNYSNNGAKKYIQLGTGSSCIWYTEGQGLLL